VKKACLLLLLLCSCGSKSLRDFDGEAERICKLLTKELQKVETREELLEAEGKLGPLFQQLVDLMLSAESYAKQHLEEAELFSNAYDEPLLEEMMRVYRIEGGREIVERAQREALIRLDKTKQK